jgi:hypothetical protein
VKFFSDRELRRRYGDVSAMTVWRWRQAGLLPRPTNFNGRNYTPEPAVLECDKHFQGKQVEAA